TMKQPPGRRELLYRTELVASSDRHASASTASGQSPRSWARNRRASPTWSAVARNERVRVCGDAAATAPPGRGENSLTCHPSTWWDTVVAVRIHRPGHPERQAGLPVCGTTARRRALRPGACADVLDHPAHILVRGA